MDEFKYTYADLEKAMSDLAHHKGELKKWEAMRNTAKAAMESHQRFVDSAQDAVDRAQGVVDKLIRSLGK